MCHFAIYHSVVGIDEFGQTAFAGDIGLRNRLAGSVTPCEHGGNAVDGAVLSREVDAGTFGGYDELSLRSVGVGCHFGQIGDVGKCEFVAADVEGGEYGTFGECKFGELVAGYIDFNRLGEVVEVDGLKVVVGNVDSLHEIHVLERVFRQSVVAQVEVGDCAMVVERDCAEEVVAELDVAEHILAVGAVGSFERDGVEVVSAQVKAAQAAVHFCVGLVKSGVGNFEFTQFGGGREGYCAHLDSVAGESCQDFPFGDVDNHGGVSGAGHAHVWSHGGVGSCG